MILLLLLVIFESPLSLSLFFDTLVPMENIFEWLICFNVIFFFSSLLLCLEVGFWLETLFFLLILVGFGVVYAWGLLFTRFSLPLFFLFSFGCFPVLILFLPYVWNASTVLVLWFFSVLSYQREKLNIYGMQWSMVFSDWWTIGKWRVLHVSKKEINEEVAR